MSDSFRSSSASTARPAALPDRHSVTMPPASPQKVTSPTWICDCSKQSPFLHKAKMDRGNEQRGKGRPFRELSFVKSAAAKFCEGLGG